jgi:hypothetical protein
VIGSMPFNGPALMPLTIRIIRCANGKTGFEESVHAPSTWQCAHCTPSAVDHKRMRACTSSCAAAATTVMTTNAIAMMNLTGS